MAERARMSGDQVVLTSASTGLGGKRVLVCEDEAMTVLMVQKALRRAGMEVIECVSDGEAAISIARREKPDIVIMDLGLAGVDGIAAARRILKQIETCLVFLSGHSDFITIEDALRAGAAVYLVKPVDSLSLIASLEKWCTTPLASRAVVAM